MPIGNRAIEPSSTGTATKKAVLWAVSPNALLNSDAKALISPHAAKQMANEIVPYARFRVAAGFGLVGIAGRVFEYSPDYFYFRSQAESLEELQAPRQTVAE
jgi:hypothetical protein